MDHLNAALSYRSDLVSLWADYRDLKAGDDWHEKILESLDNANVFLVLMSVNFINSPYCRSQELSRILLKGSKEGALVIGVLVGVVDLEGFKWEYDDGSTLDLKKLNCLPQTSIKVAGEDKPNFGLKAIELWPSNLRNTAWNTVVLAVTKAMPGSPSAAQPREMKPSSRVALSLPYLIDRQGQCSRLNVGLRSWAGRRYKKPLVVLSDGRHADCLDKWVERLALFHFREALGISEDEISFGHHHFLALPSNVHDGGTIDLARQYFEGLLPSLVGLRGIAAFDEVVRIHRKNKRPLLIWIECTSPSTKELLENSIEGLVSLLAAWGGLGEQNMLIVMLNLVRSDHSSASEVHPSHDLTASILNRSQSQDKICFVDVGVMSEIDKAMISGWSVAHAKDMLCDDIDVLVDELPGETETWPMKAFAQCAKNWLVGHA